MRRISTALSKSPSASSSAFLQSIIPAPVSVPELLDVRGSEVSHGRSLLRRRRRYCGQWRVADGAGGSVRRVGASAAGASPASAGAASAAAASRPAPRRRRRPRPPAASASPRGRAARAPTRPAARPRRRSAARPRAAAPERAIRPSATASAMTRVSSAARADRVVVARDRVVDLVRVAVGVEHRDDRDAQLAGLADGDVLLLGVDDPDRARAASAMSRMPPRVLSSLILLAGAAAAPPSWCSPCAPPVARWPRAP